MKKSELVDQIAESAEISKTKAAQALAGVIEAITGALKKGDSVALVGFGTFNSKDRPAREGRHPRTGEPMTIAASRVASFKAGKTLKEAINS